MMRRKVLVAGSLLAAGVVASAQSPSSDWPQLFGPARNSTSSATIAGNATLSVAWKKSMPSGGAGLVVAADRVYTLGTDGEQDLLIALDLETGNQAWTLPLGQTHADAAANGPNSTPALAGHLLMTISTACQLQAVDLQARKIVWTQDIGGTFASRFVKRGGCGMSPLVAGSRVILVTGAATGPRLAAFDVATGKPSWTSTDLSSGYNIAPGWTSDDGGTVLYHHSKPPGVSGVTAIDAQTGAVRWQIDGKEGESDATPVKVGTGRLLIETWPQVSLYDVATRAQVWTTRAIAAQRNPPIVHNGHIYTFGGQSSEFMTCLDAANGEVKWSARIYRGHLLRAGDTLAVLSESAGLLRLVAADPSGYREIAKVPVLTPGARTGTPPSFAGGRIFARNLEQVVAVQVK